MPAKKNTHALAVAAMLSAVAFVLMFLEVPLPFLIPPFIKLDVSDLPELLAAFALGPLWGVLVAFLKNVLFLLLHGTSSSYAGELCNFLFGAVFACTAGIFYQHSKTRHSALLGAVLGAAAMALLSLPLNYYVVYPVYAQVFAPMDAILAAYQSLLPAADTLWKCLLFFNLPFTFGKGLLDVGLCFLIYKPLSPLLHR